MHIHKLSYYQDVDKCYISECKTFSYTFLYWTHNNIFKGSSVKTFFRNLTILVWIIRYLGCYLSIRIQFINPERLNLFFLIVIQLQLYAFSPHPSTPPQLNPPPSPPSTLPLGFVYVSFIVVPVIPSTHCPRPPPPPWLLLDCS